MAVSPYPMHNPITTFGIIVYANTPVYGIVYQGQVFEAYDPNAQTIVVGNTVLADYLPSSGQWIIVSLV